MRDVCNFLIFYILIDDEFSERNKELLTNQVEKYGHNIVFVNMKDAYKEENLKIAHISHHTYYRLQLPKPATLIMSWSWQS